MPDWRRSLGDAAPYLGLGMQIALSMAFFVMAGYAVDVWLDVLPWGTIAGALIGLGTVFYHLVRVLNTMNRASPGPAQRETQRTKEKNGGSDASSGDAPSHRPRDAL